MMQLTRRHLFGILIGAPAIPTLAKALPAAPPVHPMPIVQPMTVHAINGMPLPVWWGETAEQMQVGARTIISANRMLLWNRRSCEYLYWRDFYYGAQWDLLVEKDRNQLGRPALVKNFLPSLVAAAIAADERRGLSPLEDREVDKLAMIIAIRNRDAQRMYNYMLSNWAEAEALITRRWVRAL